MKLSKSALALTLLLGAQGYAMAAQTSAPAAAVTQRQANRLRQRHKVNR